MTFPKSWAAGCGAFALALAVTLAGASRADVSLTPSAGALPSPVASAGLVLGAGASQTLRGVMWPGRRPVTASAAFDELWLAGQPAATGDAEFECLAKALYFEARGESLRGQAAVAEVILNRRESPDFPRTVCGVVGQGGKGGCQFSFTCDGASDRIREPEAWDRARKVARAMLDGAPRLLTDGATHFHTPSVRPGWSRRFEKTAVIGRHIFYRAPIRTAMN